MEPVRDLELYRGLEQALGASVATALMDRLPPEPVKDLATKTDLRNELSTLRQELKGGIAVLDQRMTGELATFRQEMKDDIAMLDQRMAGELATFRQAMTGDTAVLDQRMKGEFATFRQEINGEFAVFRKEINGEFAVVRQEISGEFAMVRQETNGLKHELMATVRGEMIDAIHTQGRQLAFTLAGSLVGLSGLAFAIANLAS